MRRGVCPGLDLGEGRDRGVEASIVVGRAERAEKNHWSSWLGEEPSGGCGTSQSLSLLSKIEVQLRSRALLV